MKSVILCEGRDDLTFIGYYLYKVSNKSWIYTEKNKLSKSYDIPISNKREATEIYKRADDRIAICCVGGKDCFCSKLKRIFHINKSFPSDNIDNVFIVQDRDNNEISDVLQNLTQFFKENNFVIDLKNNTKNTCTYEADGEDFQFNVYPIIIPFNENGALETLLLNGIAEQGNEEKKIVEKAKGYVDDIKKTCSLTKYLNHDRMITKAKFSSAVSIFTPDRSTQVMNDLLMSFAWEKAPNIERHFALLKQL